MYIVKYNLSMSIIEPIFYLSVYPSIYLLSLSILPSCVSAAGVARSGPGATVPSETAGVAAPGAVSPSSPARSRQRWRRRRYSAAGPGSGPPPAGG